MQVDIEKLMKDYQEAKNQLNSTKTDLNIKVTELSDENLILKEKMKNNSSNQS